MPEIAVVSLADGTESIILNPVGTLLWQELRTSSGATVQTLILFLCNKFSDLSTEQASQDVEKFLEKLAKHQLLSLR